MAAKRSVRKAAAKEATRKIVYGLGISMDGYIARPDGSVDYLFIPKDYSMAPFFERTFSRGSVELKYERAR